MEVKMPYIRQLGSGFIIIEVVLGDSFLILLGDLKLAIILGTIFAVGITIMAVTEQIIYHRYKIPPIKELVEKEHQIIVYGAASSVEIHNIWNIFKRFDMDSKGGVLFLLDEGVYFREWREKNPYEIMIPYRDIKKVRRYIWVLINIKIYYGDDKCEKFIAYRPGIWTKKIREFMKEAQKDEEVSKR